MNIKLSRTLFTLTALALLLPTIVGGSNVPPVLAARPARPLATTWVVASAADSGPGTLRYHLTNAVSSDTITFDPAVFLPTSPVTIALTSALPTITQGNLTIDASNAGVILDGSGTPAGTPGLDIASSGNTIRGLQILYFTGNGISIYGGTQNNTIGGDRTIGNGPMGQGNLISGNGNGGVEITGNGVTNNTVSGSNIGTDISGMVAMGNACRGVSIIDGASLNVIGGDTPGERNVISGNGCDGVLIGSTGTMSNTVSGNYIGTNVSGTAAISNTWCGVFIAGGAQYNIIGGNNGTPGGPCTGDCNLISGNNGDYGVGIAGTGAMSNTVSGNYIGTDVSGTAAISNGGGVWICCGAQYNVIGGDTEGKRNIINGDGPGVQILGSGTMSNTVRGNYIGTNVSGMGRLGNIYSGIAINSGAQYNVIGGNNGTPGGSCTGDCNLISGNGRRGVSIGDTGTMSNTVSGNYIGTNVSGTAAISNTMEGVRIFSGAQYNVIGGDTAAERNLISGNGQRGVFIDGSGTMSNTVSGNYIGTNVSGTAAISNTDDGITISGGASYNRIGGDNGTPGGSCSGDCNLISGNGGNGVKINGTMSNTVSGNYIGTNVSGTAVIGNIGDGVQIYDGAQYNVIGGDTPGERNLISGNGSIGVNLLYSSNNTVSGNYIGTDVNGISDLGNAYEGVSINEGASNNTIGGSNASPGGACTGECNLISGNDCPGIWMGHTGTVSNTISGNYIGTDVSGTAAIGNAFHGVGIWNGAQGNVVGGATAGERNIISGNGDRGVGIGNSGTMSNTVRGNYIGTNAGGTGALGNASDGVQINSGAQGNTVGGSTAAERNLISGNGGRGVSIGDTGTMSNTVSGNYIGTNVSGTAAISNTREGVQIFRGAQYNVIGGDNGTPGGACTGDCNLISGNNAGVNIGGSSAMSNTVSGNYIGTDVSGEIAIGNSWQGIYIGDRVSSNRIGGSTASQSNIIAYNKANGVFVTGTTTLNNTITHNSIHSNIGLGIDNVNGGNTELSPPIMTQLTGGSIIAGTACAGCVIEVFSDDAEEGRIFEGSTTADGSGHFSFYKPGGFACLNVTATATDAAGNTSEFSTPMPTVLPSISQIMPSQGTNNVPNEINIYGLHFASGITASLGTTPPISLAVQFITTTHVRAAIPADLSPGTFDLTVFNPGGGADTLEDAYTVFEPANDDLFGYSYELWTDPPTLRAGEQAGIGLVVHRQGGDSTLSDVVVRFYQGDPGHGGATIGNGVIALLSPRSSESTPRVNWTPPTAGTYELYAVIDPDNTITETLETNNTVSCTVAVFAPPVDDLAPHVDSFTINDGASSTNSANVTLDATASDNPGGSGVASLLYLEFEYSQGAGQWIPAQNSGWVAYSTASSNYPWRLLPVAGMRYMQAWAADAVGNISLYPYRAYINYVPSSDHVDQGQVRIYRQTVGTGQTLTVRVTPISGDPDLYVWPPDWPIRPPWASYSSSGVDEVSFSAPVNGVYQIEVYGYTSADYQISISISLASERQRFVMGGARLKTPRDSPGLPVSSVPGEQIALPPAVAPHTIYLPVILHSS